MRKKRFLSVALVCAMLSAQLPVSLAAASDDSVIYNRYVPEVAILNAKTGNNTSFYNKLKGLQKTDEEGSDTAVSAYPQYNAMEMLYGKNGGNWTWKMQFNKGDALQKTLSWGPKEINGASVDFKDSTMKKLMSVQDNLEVKLSARFLNHQHTHKKNWFAGWEVNSFLTGRLSIGGKVSDYVTGASEVGITTTRDGDDDDYKTLNNPTDDGGGLTFTRSELKYDGEKTCTCVGASADRVLITFRDDRAPSLEGVYYSDDGSDFTKYRYSSRQSKELKKGSTVYIQLKYDEPIRFSDDSTDGKNLLYLGLQTEGKSVDENHKAYLYRLDGDSLYFKYTVPDGLSENADILSLNTASLFTPQTGSTIPLVQLCRDDANGRKIENFTLASDLKGDDGTNGFSTSTCYITDLAGNSLNNESISSPRLRIDSVAPYVENISYNVSLNNSDVKEAKALSGNDSTSSGTEGNTVVVDDSKDDSDRYLGAGDTVAMNLTMSEALNLELTKDTSTGYYLMDWKYGWATTNIIAPKGYATSDSIKVSDDGYIMIRTRWFTPSVPNTYFRRHTCFVLETLTITEGMKVKEDAENNPGGYILVTKFDLSDYSGDVTDLCGNAVDKNNVTIGTGANSNAYSLDTEAPTVTGSDYTPSGDGFRYTVTIDKGTGTEVAGTYGTFVLNHSGDDRAYQYQWAVTAEANTNNLAEYEWNIGTTGVEQKFIQHQTCYFHIKPYADENYATLDQCTLTVKGKDYAGNIGTLTADKSIIEWYVDNVAPSVSAGNVNRALSGDRGTISADVVLSDSHGISEWFYAWGDSESNAPSTWTQGSISESTDTTRTVTAEESLSAGEKFSKYLWVKAVDDSKKTNSTELICLGLYTYDLTAAKYSLKYTNAVTEKADLKVSSLDADDCLVFMIPTDKENQYNVNTLTSDKVDASANIFALSGWRVCEVSEENGAYTFSSVYEPSSTEFTQGNINLRVLSGKKDGVTFSNGVIASAGNASYQFSSETVKLRVAGTNPWKNYSILDSDEDIEPNDYIKLTCDTDLSVCNQDDIWSYEIMNTLAGLVFDIKISNPNIASLGGTAYDRYGWKCEDIDTAKSKLVVRKHGDDTETETSIGAFSLRSDGSYGQKVALGGEYDTGVYDVVLKLVSVTGKTAEIPCGELSALEGIVVDATEPNDKLTLSSIAYSAKSLGENEYTYQIDKEYQPREYAGDDIITLPVSGGSLAVTYGDQSFVYPLTFTSEGEGKRGTLNNKDGRFRSYTGQYYIEVWNESFDKEKKVRFDCKTEEQETVTNDNTNVGFSTDENCGWFYVYLKPDTENLISFRKVYSNGKTSSTQKVRIKPVTKHLTGTLSADKTTNQIIFKPSEGLNLSDFTDVQVYAFAYQNTYPNDYKNGLGELIPMSLSAYGDWRCSAVSGGAIYRVFTINSAGSIWAGDESTFVSQRAPWFSAMDYTDNGNGTYTLTFSVYDDYQTMMQDGLDINLSFNDDYCTEGFRLKIEDGMENLTVNEAAQYKSYQWNTKGVGNSGIYDVYFWTGSTAPSGGEPGYDGAYFTISGAVRKQNADTQSAQSMNITLQATDAFGNTGEQETGTKSVSYQAPKVTGNSLTEYGLQLNFNQPVYPAESWAWSDSDPTDSYGNILSYSKEWAGAFPIVANGTHTVSFLDVFGNLCEEEVTTNAFTVDGYDWSMDIDFSETALTKEAVSVTATLTGGDNLKAETGIMIVDGEGDIIIPEGLYNGKDLSGSGWIDYHPSNSWSSGNAKATSTPRTVKLSANDRLKIGAYDTYHVGESLANNKVYVQRVYVNNIANEAPDAQLHFYFPSLGQEFLEEGLRDYVKKHGENGTLTIEGKAQVWYKTSRHVSPTNDTKSEIYFDKDTYQNSYTFRYADDMGNNGSKTVSLSDYGIVLKEPSVPYVDKTAPTVDVEISRKAFGSYTTLESFRANLADETERKDKFEGLGLAQGFGLTVNASDESGFTIKVSGENDASLPEGVSFAGNQITVTKAASFVVTVTDLSAQKNETSFKVTAEMLKNLDTTAPTATFSTEATSMYEKKITVTLSDKDDNGNDTTAKGFTLSEPSEAVKKSGSDNIYEYRATTNGDVEFVFYDSVGNRSESGKNTEKISGIDTEPPKLSVTWSPPYTYWDWEAEEYKTEYGSPMAGITNKNVTAFVDSDKAMYRLTVDFAGLDETVLLDKGAPTTNNPYDIWNDEHTELLASISAAPERIVMTYYGNFYEYTTFTATAANGESSKASIDLTATIDKTAPVVDVKTVYKYREGCSVPYSAEVTFKPNEGASSQNYGKTETDDEGNTFWVNYYEDEPLVVEFKKNGTFNAIFTDEAGNVSVVPVKIEGLDRTAPSLTLNERTESAQQTTIGMTADEDCTVSVSDGRNTVSATKDNAFTLSFTDNGSYLITATDKAGNESTRTITVGNIDKIMPSVSFDTNTIYLLQNSSESDLASELASGYTVWDDKTDAADIGVSIDSSAVKLDTAGLYTVVYTISDKAGNERNANRFVQIIGEDTVCIRIDGNLILPGGTAVVKAGETHTMTLQNCEEPFSVKARKGILGLGQMKVLTSNSLSFDESGRFTANTPGYYTLLVTTQSRQTIRILMYVSR